MPHIRVSELGQHWFWQWLVACSAPSHYLNQFWLIVNWIPGNKFQLNLYRNFIIFIQENAFENIICQIGGHFVQGEMSQQRNCPKYISDIPTHIDIDDDDFQVAFERELLTMSVDYSLVLRCLRIRLAEIWLDENRKFPDNMCTTLHLYKQIHIKSKGWRRNTDYCVQNLN